MKWKIKLSICTLLAAAAIVCAAAASAQSKTGPAGPPEDDAAIIDGYVLREHDGYIAVYGAAGGNLDYVTGIEVKNLREVDRDLLAQGIWAGSREDMTQLLEDLGS